MSAEDQPTGQPNAAVQEFTAVHRMIRGLLTKLEDVLSHERDDAGWRKTLGSMIGFGTNGLRFHHHVEDTEYFPAILNKGGDPGLISPLQNEHHEIDELLNQMDVTAGALQTSESNAGNVESARSLVNKFAGHVRDHLDAEEPVFFPLLEQYIANDEAHVIAKRVAKAAPRKGISWLMGATEYAMTPEQSKNFLSTFPKPLQWARPMMLRSYRKNCATLGVSEQFG
jgi:hemerythrin-like domain-containing protein